MRVLKCDHICVSNILLERGWFGGVGSSSRENSQGTVVGRGPNESGEAWVGESHGDGEYGFSTYCVILGKSLKLSEPRFPHLSNESNKSSSSRGFQHASCGAGHTVR